MPEEVVKPPYSPAKTAAKGLNAGVAALAAGIGAVIVTAAAGAISNDVSVTAILHDAHIPGYVSFILVPVIVGLGRSLGNWIKNRNN